MCLMISGVDIVSFVGSITGWNTVCLPNTWLGMTLPISGRGNLGNLAVIIRPGYWSSSSCEIESHYAFLFIFFIIYKLKKKKEKKI